MPRRSYTGFTLVELMIVIAIAGIITLLATNINFSRQATTEKSNRITSRIHALLQSTKIQVSSGRGVLTGGTIKNPTSTELMISTGAIAVRYYSGTTLIGTGDTLVSPFFGDPKYTIASIYRYTDATLTTTGSLTNPVRIIFDSDRNISFSGSDASIDTAVMIWLRVGYSNQLHTIELDRRSGKITNK